ncbi:glycosyltransferase family 2 protein [Glycomyces sp. L485]|uniref:glycosyltransferase family 2 protein n=1 Tax=Glycomyces sp. L485 TaxID=2909235 RepID=UPI001F4B0B35|nr:glycosyltransferase family A protein [Glycomyces sp. L485]MCH7231751.1 glycosyltransferase family 2 protein [Glycomyces sp. L485]
MTDSLVAGSRPRDPGFRHGPNPMPTAGDDAPRTGGSETVDRLVERALVTAKACSVNDIYLWGQYHNSRLARHVLARLACPDDPDAVLRPGADRSRLSKAALNLEAVCALAASIALKARDHDERATALELFDLAHRRLDGRIPLEYREPHVMTAYLDGRGRRVKTLIGSYGELPCRLDEAIRCQDAHPCNGGSARGYLRRLKEFADWPELSDPDDDAPLSIDRLRTRPVEAVEGGHLISVVMTCFKPDKTLLTAVRSIVAQSWQNWELLLVDDGSGAEYRNVLREAAALDQRVKLLIQPQNAGTYQARNRALAVAKGRFVTGLDSDDWAHPHRLEKQVRPLIDNPGLVMVESHSIAVREDLSLMIDPQTAVIAARSTPIMVRADPVLRRIGFFDEVRKTADSEFRSRVKTVFGRRAVARLATGPLTLVRHSATTLSAGEVSRHWMSASRLAYHSGFTDWHRNITKGTTEPFMASLARPRPFPIARDITRTKAQNREIAYGRIFAADWRSLDRRRRLMLDDAALLAESGVRVGLVHRPEWTAVDGARPLINRSVLASASKYGFDFIDLEERHTAPIVVPTKAYVELLRFEHPELAVDRIRVQSAEPEPAEKPRLSTETGRGRTASRRALTKKEAALAGAGLCATAAAIGFAAVVEPTSLQWSAGGSLAIWTGLVLAMITRRFAFRSVSG